MNIYLEPPQQSRGLQRIADALSRYRPRDSDIVTDLHKADLVVLYAIGRCDSITEKAHSIMMRGQRYAVVQVCLRSTQKPKTMDWQFLWTGADCVWSYYDLRQAVIDDYGDPTFIGVSEFDKHVNFYHAPLGADAGVFRPRATVRDFTILTTGLSRLSESVRECALAVEAVGGQGYHIGPRLRLGDSFEGYNDISDDAMALLMSGCQFVSGLRRIEGFELPAIEGLLCGARPIVFDTPDYHWNYGEHAEYIQETDRQGVVSQLVTLFKQGPRPVTEDERQRAVARYNWQTIVEGFYGRL